MGFLYWQHICFELDLLTDAECKSEFKFYRNGIYRLAKVLNTPDQIICYNRSKLDGIEAFYIILKRFSCPCWYFDIIQQCGRSVPEVSVFLLFFFHQMVALQKLWKMLYILSKKIFLFSRDSDFCNYFPSFPYFLNSKRQRKVQ